MQKISALSDASFIVIGDNKGLHLFHSVFADRVGTTLVGGDNEAVLQGKSITTIRKGGLGISLRSKAPIFNNAGQVVGIVSVGYLTSYLDTITVSKVVNILIAAVLLLIGPLCLLLVLYPQHKEADLLPRAARDRSAGAPAEGDDGVHLRRRDRH